MAREERSHILSNSEESSRRDAHVLEMVPSMDWNVYCLLTITGFLLNALLNLLEQKHRKVENKTFINYAWILFATHYRQISFRFCSIRSNILYLIYGFMHFIILVHVTLLFSSNMMIETKGLKIETLKNLIDQNKEPIFIKGRPVTDYVLKANNEEAALIRNKMKIKGYHQHIINFDPFEIGTFSQFIENKAVVSEKVWIQYVERYLKWGSFFGVQKNYWSRSYISSNPVHKTLEGFIHNFKKDDIPSCLVKGYVMNLLI